MDAAHPDPRRGRLPGRGGAGHRHDDFSYAAILIVLGVTLTLLAGRSWRERGLALRIAPPLTAVGYVLLSFTFSG